MRRYNAKSDSFAPDLGYQFSEDVKNCVGQFVIVAIAGGTSVTTMFAPIRYAMERLLSPQERARLRFVMLDERMVAYRAPTGGFHKDLNYGVWAKFFRDLTEDRLITDDQIVPFVFANYNKEDKKFGTLVVEDYNTKVAGLHGGKAGFDIVLAGVGEDGHIAAVFPDHPSVQHVHEGYFQFSGSPKPPEWRMTASPEMIMRAPFVYLLFIGRNKWTALSAFLDEVPWTENPASMAHQSEARIISDLF